jgi:hypothetical protein
MSEEEKQGTLEGEETPSEYLEHIMADVRRLSGIIDVISTLDADDVYAHNPNFDNLAFAMKYFTYSIEDLAKDFYHRLRDGGILHTKLPQGDDH